MNHSVLRRVQDGMDLFSHPSGMIVDRRIFLPTGQTYVGAVGEDPRPNPGQRRVDWSKRRPVYEATLYVGFKVKGDSPIDMFILMAMVHDLLHQRRSNASSSFIAQHGIWQMRRNLRADFEQSASVRLLAGRSVNPEKWSSIIQEVAEEIATIARQQVVIVQFSLNGSPVDVLKITPKRNATGLASLEAFRVRGAEVRLELEGPSPTPPASRRTRRRAE